MAGEATAVTLGFTMSGTWPADGMLKILLPAEMVVKETNALTVSAALLASAHMAAQAHHRWQASRPCTE